MVFHIFGLQTNSIITYLLTTLFRGLLDNDELGNLTGALEQDEGVMSMKYGRSDGEGRKAKVVLWNQPGNDITGILARSDKMAGTFEKV